MTANVLIAHASRYGATAEIAEAIGRVLRDAGIAAAVLPVDQVENLAPYTAVVLGSAVYMGHWRKEAVRFLENHEAALTARPTWLFSSGPTGEGNPVELMKGWRFPEGQKALADSIHPRDVTVFHGVLDAKRLNFADRLIIKAVKAPVGDFRDWERIDMWARSIADELSDQLVEAYPI